MSENNEPSQKINISNRTALIILVVLVVAVAIVLFFVFPNKDDGGSEEPTSPPTTSSSSDPGSDNGGNPPPSEDMSPEPPRTPEPDPKGEAHGGGNHDKPPFVNGTEYIMTEEAIKEWEPIRKKFILGLLGDGNIAQATQGTTTPEVAKEIAKLQDGAHKDSIPEDLPEDDHEQLYIGPYELTEKFKLTSGKYLTLTIAWVAVDNTKSAWLITDYKVE